MKEIDALTQHLSNQLNGEPIPDFRSEDHREVMAAVAAIADATDARHLAEKLGLRVLTLIVDRLSAGRVATRELAIIQQNKGELC